MTDKKHAQSPPHPPRRLAGDHGHGHSCWHRLVQEQLSFSGLGCDPGLSVLLVFERISLRSLSDVFDAGPDLVLGMGDALRQTNAVLDPWDRILSGNHPVIFCASGWRCMKALVIFSGLPGTGKSTLATRLARQLHWPLLCIDDVIGDVPENAGIAFWDSRVAILLDVIETQLKVGLSVIADSVFMNMDRHHAQELARKYQARFLPIYVFVSDENVWKERVTNRSDELNDKDVATWENIQHQRERFRAWEPGTALFVDSLNPVDENYESVLNFVMKDDVTLKPLSKIELVEGKYH